jgi:hypothetical protein
MAVAWLALTTLILVGTYISLPIIANNTIAAVHSISTESAPPRASTNASIVDSGTPHIELYSIGLLALSLLAVLFASFLIGRAAFVEIELAARFMAFADALCLAGDDFDRLEKAANLLLPGTKYLSVPEIFSTKDLGSAVDLLKELRPK